VPELAQLRAFAAVAQELSFTRAAQRLGVSQGTASKAVRALEEELDVALLERSTRAVRLTRAGAALLDGCGEILALVDATLAEVADIGAMASGTIRVGVTPAIGPRDRADAITALSARGDDLVVALRDVRPAQLRPLLRAGELDVALVRAHGLAEPGISATALRPTPMVLCVPAGHRLAGERAVAVRALDGERLLLPSRPGTPYADLVLAQLRAAGAEVEAVEARVTGGDVTLVELGEHGAVALMPVGTQPPPGVQVVELDGGLHLPLFVLRATGRPSPAVRALVAALAP
jgi:DNA-binding transcriptional LysR family regulator